MTHVDLLIVGGTVVTPRGRTMIDVGVKDGLIHSIGSQGLTATRTVDAAELFVMPGGVDTHVHLMDPGAPEREDFPTGTRAAAAAGVTTIIEHTHGRPVRSVADLGEKVDYLRGRSYVDFGLAAHAWPGDTQSVSLLWAAGAAFFKVFTCTTHGVPGHTAAALKEHLEAAARVGAVSLLHCEDESLTETAAALLQGDGRDDPGLLPEWRNLDAELVAAAVAALLVRRTGARASVAHVSNQEVASYIAAERNKGAFLNAEACPQYFLLRESEVHSQGTLRKFTPPARARTDDDERQMWRLLRDGVLTHMSSDHAPSTLVQKADGGVWNAHFGLPGLDSTMTVLLDAAARGHLSYEDITRVYSEAPAKIYGLWPRKGSLNIGSDADFLLVNPAATRTFRNADVISKAGWTPFDGRKMTGAVTSTYLRGQLISEDGEVLDTRMGKFLPGAGSSN